MNKFWRFSSSNIHGRVPHPKTKYQRERVLNLWAALNTCEEIADQLEIPIDTVTSYIKRARIRGDARAARRRQHWRKRQEKANTRRMQIQVLHEAGMAPADIAKTLNVCRTLVVKRLKESADA